jgi:hypothetical protein
LLMMPSPWLWTITLLIPVAIELLESPNCRE